MSHDEMVRTGKVLAIVLRRCYPPSTPMGPSIREALETITKRKLTDGEWVKVSTEIL